MVDEDRYVCKKKKKKSIIEFIKIYHLKLKIIGDALKYTEFYYLLYKC
jgi:hypothetical protein